MFRPAEVREWYNTEKLLKRFVEHGAGGLDYGKRTNVARIK